MTRGRPNGSHKAPGALLAVFVVPSAAVAALLTPVLAMMGHA